MPAVDFRLPGGLSWGELGAALRLALESGKAVGLEITIDNPRLDEGGSAGRGLTDLLAAALPPGIDANAGRAWSEIVGADRRRHAVADQLAPLPSAGRHPGAIAPAEALGSLAPLRACLADWCGRQDRLRSAKSVIRSPCDRDQSLVV